jgi:hypothetical protein
MFYLYNITKKNQKQVETLVREIAFKKSGTKGKSRK